MRRLKQVVISCMFVLTITASYPIVSEVEEVNTGEYHITVTDIVIKVKYVNGVKYIRRWDQANNVWIDDEWKRVG